MAESVAIPKGLMQDSCNSDANKNTPPDQNISLPLTPPASAQRSAGSSVDQAIEIFQALQNGHPELPYDELKEIPLPPEKYLELIDALERDQSLQEYVSDKVRWDYNSKAGCLYIRMPPTPLHDFFADAVAIEIHEQLQCIAKGEDPAGEFAAQIRNGGSARIFLNEVDLEKETANSKIRHKRHPDKQFQYHGTAYPGVVLEVSYAQRVKKLSKLAREYILHSDGNIKVVIGVDINYRKTDEACVSLWRPLYIHEEGEEFDILDVQQEIEWQPFRSPDGSPMNETQHICLKLSDFAPDELSADIQEKQLEIRYAKLAEFLNYAQQMHQTRESNSGIKSKRRIRKRKLSSSAEAIGSEDEALYCLWEKEVAERSERRDPDFNPPSRRRRRA